jgi:hypothetical protein
MNYKKLNTEQLKEQCSLNNISPIGRKDELIKRLTQIETNRNTQLEFNSTIEVVSPREESKISQDTLFIQLKSSNLSYYFNYGAIYPLDLEESEIYKTENRKKDLFTQFSEYIILSPAIINSFEDDDILVEIITKNLKVKSIDNSNLSYIGEPIPISRIKNIYFKTVVAQNTFISSVKTFPDSFIQEQLCLITPMSFPIQKEDLSKIELPHNLDLVEWKIVLRKFDKIMGMFSFMKNAGVFFAEIDNSYQEYTPNYFCALSIINSTVKAQSTKDLGLYRYILFPFEIEASNVQRVLFRQIMDSIHNDLSFDLILANKIIQEALASRLATADEEKELKLILDYFKKLEQHQIAYKDLLMVDVIRKNYPVLALLFLSRFSNKSRQHTDKQAVRNTFILHEAQFNKSVTEYLLGVLGLYYGYKTMIKQDTNLNTADNTFASISEQLQSIKFRLTSPLDRITIESIFNFCKTNKTISEEYSFLNLQSSKKQPTFSLPNWGAFVYSDNSCTVCNTKITIVDRKHKSEDLLNVIDRNYSDRISDKSLLAHYLVSNFGLNKKALLDLVKANISKLSLDELAQLIDLDQRQKNNR